MRHRSTPKPANAAGRAGALRIIGGQYRGRKLPVAEVEGLRPTGDRLREVLFNWLQFELAGARVLDLFAGSGALGLEAASRGAEAVWLVERHPGAARQLRESVRLLGCAAQVVEADAIAWLKRSDVTPVDGVFLDPPFAAGLWQPALAALLSGGRLKPGAWIYIEASARQSVPLPQGLVVEKDKRAGEVMMQLVRYHPAS
ncbi:MAG: 16S rRNA (guanine(966)-N(2))-methyltransferase RsmD [Saccharospirillum sp.]